MINDQPSKEPARPSWQDRLVRLFARQPASNEQLIELLRSAHQHDLYDADVLAMLEGVLTVDDMQVRDIMIPRSQVVILERETVVDSDALGIRPDPPLERVGRSAEIRVGIKGPWEPVPPYSGEIRPAKA